jgi:myo-inositol-1(or 4)-monophosphatase
MSDYLATAVEIARQAAGTLREGHGRAGQVDFKGAVDLVTEWDRRSERLIVEALQAAYPDHAIHAEEGGGNNHPSDYQWIVDPLDGTTNFAHALPVFAVSIALLHRGRPLVGVVADVLREEYYTAEAGGGATLNGRPIRVSPTASLAMSLLGTGFPYDLRSDSGEILEQFANFAVRSQAVRRIGSAALDLAWTAAGRFDGYWEFRLKPWDVAAGALIVAEAGGTVTDAAGGDAYLSGDSIVASNGLIHEAMMRVLREGKQAPLPQDKGN